jgi:hypothetical protein
MKTNFLMTGAILALLGILLSYLGITLCAASFRRKHYPGAAPNTAQGIALSGKLLAVLLLVPGTLFPVKDFLLISPVSPAFWIFTLICTCIFAASCLLAAMLEGWISQSLFKGLVLAAELHENNTSVATVRAVISLGLAITLVFCLGPFMQAFVPVPAIPNIQ